MDRAAARTLPVPRGRPRRRAAASSGEVAGAVPQAVELSLTRTQPRAALTWDAHQLVWGIGQADDLVTAARRGGR
jgi:ribose 1,5-bisphosphokinase PhnN